MKALLMKAPTQAVVVGAGFHLTMALRLDQTVLPMVAYLSVVVVVLVSRKVLTLG